MGNKRYMFLLASAALIAAVAPLPAFAQAGANFERDKNVGVTDRARPDYDAAGIPVSSFILLPKLDVTAQYDDNIYATETNAVDDFIVQMQPSVAIKSQWSRHELDALVHSSINRYISHDTEDTADYGGALNGRLDILAGTYLNAKASYDLLTEPRESDSFSRNTISPIQYTLWDVGATAVNQFNRLQVSLSADLNRYHYYNGVDASNAPVLENDRNVENVSQTLRADYAINPDTAVFVSASHNQQDYTAQPPVVISDRNGIGYELLGGVNFQVTNLIQGEFSAGYLTEQYNHVIGQNYSNVAFHSLFHWYPTELTTVTVKADRVANNSQDQFSAGYITTGGSLAVDHELRWNVILNLLASYNEDNYRGIDRVDDRWSASVGGTYLLNRNLGLALRFSHDDVNSLGLDRYISFQDNKAMLSLILQQ
jgi:hypothetical protein